jgi:hypothetical protein
MTMTINVYMLDDYDYWAGASLAECITQARRECGPDSYPDAEAEAVVLADEDMQRFKFRDEDGAVRTFTEQLAREIEAGVQFPCLFASTES